MCSVYGTVIQGLQICSEWLCLRGGKYLHCNFLTHLTDTQAKSKHASVSSLKKKKDWCLHLISLSFCLYYYHSAIHLSGLGQIIGTWVLDIFEYWVRSMQHHLNLCIIFIIIIFIAPSHKENLIVMAYRSPKTLLIFFFLFIWYIVSVIFFSCIVYFL